MLNVIYYLRAKVSVICSCTGPRDKNRFAGTLLAPGYAGKIGGQCAHSNLEAFLQYSLAVTASHDYLRDSFLLRY
jgi:hypothetical protein